MNLELDTYYDSTTDTDSRMAIPLPRNSLDSLYISVPQTPRLPGPPTFGSSSTLTQSQQRRRKHVQFLDAPVVSFIRPGSSMSVEERNQLWYPTSDLDGFKNEVRVQCRKLREPSLSPPEMEGAISALSTASTDDSSSRTLSMSSPPMQLSSVCHDEVGVSPPRSKDDEMNECPSSYTAAGIDEASDCPGDGDTRGLEHRVCLNRLRHKHLAIRCTLKAQRRSRCPDFIARISTKCTQWARELALVEGDRDYSEAYCPHKLSNSPKILNNKSPYSIPIEPNTSSTPPASKRCHDGAPFQRNTELQQQQFNPTQIMDSFGFATSQAIADAPAYNQPSLACGNGGVMPLFQQDQQYQQQHPCPQQQYIQQLQQQQQHYHQACLMERCVRQKCKDSSDSPQF